jgi:hypothetical protein
MTTLHECVTWKNATYILAGLMLSALSYIAWADTHYADANDVQEIKGILVKCLIEKKC